MAKIGDWVKSTDGMFGAVRTPTGWQTFECVICAQKLGLLTGDRLQNDPQCHGVRLMNSGLPFDYQHHASLHLD